MANFAAFPKSELGVTVYLNDGGTRAGRIRGFSPETEIILTTPAPPVRLLGKLPPPVHIPPERVAYIVVQREKGVATPPAPSEDIAEWEIQLPGERTLRVKAQRKDTQDPLGFLAWPVIDDGLFALYWFYSRSVRVMDPTPIGELLLDQGFIAEADLELGLAQQFAERGILLGQILVDQSTVAKETVEKATREQAAQLQGKKRIRLGELLVEAGIAKNEDIERALDAQKTRRGKRLGQILVELGIVQEHHISETLARKFSLPFVDLNSMTVDPLAFQEVPFELVAKYGFLPVKSDAASITVAIADPLAMEGIDMLRFRVRKSIREIVVTASQLAKHLNPLVGVQPAEGEGVEVAAQADEEASVVRFINQFIAAAYYRGASDIHVEPNGPDRDTGIRVRVDGECEAAWKIPASQRAQLVARLKIMANLNIAERRKPQDGKIVFPIGNRKIELRVASLPNVYGDEDVVLRSASPNEAASRSPRWLSNPTA